MEKTNEKKVLVLSFLGVITLILVVVGATYAYFTAQGGGTGNINVNAGTATTDNLSFQTGSAISLTANQEDFGNGMGNKSGSTYARAILTANNSTNTATRNYYVYLNITGNDFEYTTVDEQGEILLKVTDPDGTEVTNIPGLTRKTSGSGENQVTGFDITESQGLITITDNYEITSTGTETQEWQVEVIFVNLDSDQNANTGKTFNATLIIQEEMMPTNLANYITNVLYTSDGDNGLYYHDGVGTYGTQEAGDNSYRYSGGDYQVTEMATRAGLNRVYTAESSETDGVINFYCDSTKQYVGSECSNNQEYYYTTSYNETNHYNSLEEALTQAVNDGYLTNNNIKNYVCFGSDEETCPEDNLYRIIGIFNGQIKLIKATYATSDLLGTDGDFLITLSDRFYSGIQNNSNALYRYYWNNSNGSSSTNDWSTSRLNTINLNTNYLSSLTPQWQELILETAWLVGGNSWENLGPQNAKSIFTNEIVSPAEATTYSAKVGLMYVSDYMYATIPDGWTYLGNGTPTSDCRYFKDNNWLYAGDVEWTITRQTESNRIIGINEFGYIGLNYDTFNGGSLRPTFYLDSNVEFFKGSGTENNPYRIA